MGEPRALWTPLNRLESCIALVLFEIFLAPHLALDKALRLGGGGGEAQEGPLALPGDVALLSPGRCEGPQEEEGSQERHLDRQLNVE